MCNQSNGWQNSCNQSCGCNRQRMCNRCSNCNQSWGCNSCMNQNQQSWDWNNTVNGCPRPSPLVAPRRVCVSQQITPVEQPVICPIECRRVNRCMYYPVFYPQYEQTSVNMPY